MPRNSSAAPRRAKNKTWYFVVELGPGLDSKGQWRERRQAYRRGYLTKAAAQEAMDLLRSESAAGTYVAPNGQTVREFLVEDWLPARRAQLAESTWGSYERNVRHHVIPNIGGLRLQALDGTALNRMYATLLKSGRKRGQQSAGLKPRTVRYIHTIVHAALGDAVKLQKVQSNAANKATPPSAKSARSPEMKTWTAAQLAEFLGRTAGDRFGYAWSFLATTGCRRGEALGLRWNDVDLNRGLASIRQQIVALPRPSGRGTEPRVVAGTKTGQDRVVELDTRTTASLRQWKKQQSTVRLQLGAAYEDNGLVFPRPDGKPFHPEAFSKTFDRRLRRQDFADIPRIRLHDFRHTWATLALEAGVDIAIVSKQLGHASPTITWNTYQHVRKGMQGNAAERVADLIFGPVDAEEGDEGEAAATG